MIEALIREPMNFPNPNSWLVPSTADAPLLLLAKYLHNGREDHFLIISCWAVKVYNFKN